MTTSLNSSNKGSIDDKIPLLFNGFTADLAFHGDLNLIRSISDAFNDTSTKVIFDGIQLFEQASKEINRVKTTIPESKLLLINASATNQNPIADVTKHPISAALLEPIPDILQCYLSGILTMRCLLILSLLSASLKPKKYVIENLKSCAREIRLATALQTHESRKSSLDDFTQSLSDTFGINQLLINITRFSNELSDPLPKKLFQELSNLSGTIDISHTTYASITNPTPFLDETENNSINDIALTANDPIELRSLNEKLDIPSDEPDDRTARFRGEDQDLEEFLINQTNSSTASAETLTDLTIFSDANDDNLEKQKSHWQHNNQSNLPYSTSLFNTIERSWLTDELKLGLINKHHTKSTLIVAIAICTTNSLEDALDLTYGENGDISTYGTYRKHITSPDDAVKTVAPESKLYLQHSDYLELEFPSFVTQLLNTAVMSDTPKTTLREAIGYKPGQDGIEINAFFENIRAKYSSRFIIPRVKNQLKHFVLSMERDPTLAYMLFGTKTHSPPIPNYYRSMPIQAVADKYKYYSTQYFKNMDI